MGIKFIEYERLDTENASVKALARADYYEGLNTPIPEGAELNILPISLSGGGLLLVKAITRPAQRVKEIRAAVLNWYLENEEANMLAVRDMMHEVDAEAAEAVRANIPAPEDNSPAPEETAHNAFVLAYKQKDADMYLIISGRRGSVVKGRMQWGRSNTMMIDKPDLDSMAEGLLNRFHYEPVPENFLNALPVIEGYVPKPLAWYNPRLAGVKIAQMGIRRFHGQLFTGTAKKLKAQGNG